eukprot:4219697-Alexandrium_andersonii.AAC.1
MSRTPREVAAHKRTRSIGPVVVAHAEDDEAEGQWPTPTVLQELPSAGRDAGQAGPKKCST